MGRCCLWGSGLREVTLAAVAPHLASVVWWPFVILTCNFAGSISPSQDSLVDITHIKDGVGCKILLIVPTPVCALQAGAAQLQGPLAWPTEVRADAVPF